MSDTDMPQNQEMNPATWREAITCSPGPNTWKDAGWLTVKGLCMGVADIIPGVSGGTIAFITGIYGRFLAAIASVDAKVVSAVCGGKLKTAIGRIHLRFLVPLLFGIGVALVGTASLMHGLLDEHPIPTWSLFFGLIAASIIFVASQIKNWTSPAVWGALIFGTVAAYLITGLTPVEPIESHWYTLLCSMIAICAMILPGISGSFLLLILGQYLYVTGALRQLTALMRTYLAEIVPALAPSEAPTMTLGDTMLIMLVFVCGQVIGLVSFSRVLKWCLSRYHETTMAVLTGFMLGAMRKVWPWKHKLEMLRYVSGGKEKTKTLIEMNVLPNKIQTAYEQTTLLPDGTALTQMVKGDSPQLGLAIALMAAGFFAVLILEYLSREKDKELPHA